MCMHERVRMQNCLHACVSLQAWACLGCIVCVCVGGGGGRGCMYLSLAIAVPGARSANWSMGLQQADFPDLSSPV